MFAARKSLVFLLPLLLLGLAACGYVGDPLPPALHIPLPVEDLSVSQESGQLVAQFTMPARTTEDLPVEDGAQVELKAARWTEPEWNEGEWGRTAIPVAVSRVPDTNEFRGDVAPFQNHRWLFRVRVEGKSGRYSVWSGPVALRVISPQQPPLSLEAKAVDNGVVLTWQQPQSPVEAGTRRTEVWRRKGDAKDFEKIGIAEQTSFQDERSDYDVPHFYRVRGLVDGADTNASSDYSAVVSLTPVDVFAPAPPQDLTAVAATDSVELAWSRNEEEDFATCLVYRSVGDGDFTKLGEPVAASSFSDRTAPKGERLQYRITALDTKGNESQPSQTVEIQLPN